MTTGQTVVTVLDDNTRVVVVYDGPRGDTGPQGAAGPAGSDGKSITPRGDWVNNQLYVSGDAVASRTANNPGLKTLWIVRDGKTPAVGVAPHEAPTDWMEVGAASTDATASGVLRVIQTTHPFTEVGQLAAFSEATGEYQLADARDRDLMPVAMIREIVDADEFAIQFDGIVPDVSPANILLDPPPPLGRGEGSWVPGVLYYLSSSPGMLQERDPALDGYFSVPVAIASQPSSLDPQVPADLSLLGWGPDNLRAPVRISATAPPNPTPGQFWFRTDAYPGLYVAIADPTETLVMWVEANG